MARRKPPQARQSVWRQKKQQAFAGQLFLPKILSQKRLARLMIQQERLKGVPILSDNQNGYYLPENEWEVREFVRSMRHRAGEIEKAAGVIEGAYYGR